MQHTLNNFAYIDGTNLYKGISEHSIVFLERFKTSWSINQKGFKMKKPPIRTKPEQGLFRKYNTSIAPP